MAVSELIEELRRFPPESIIKIEYIDYTIYVPERDYISKIYEDDHGDICISSII